VEIGEWESFRHMPGARVVLGLGTGDGVAIGDQTHHYAPGALIATSDTTEARAVTALEQRVIVWVTAPPPTSAAGDQWPRLARGATRVLLGQTLAALFRAHGGPFPWGNVQWLNEARGDRLYGSAVRCEVRFLDPITDDDLDVATASEVDATVELDRDGTTIDDDTNNAPDA
jgi:hypothetical protein